MALLSECGAFSRRRSPCCREHKSFWMAVSDAGAYRLIVAPSTTQMTAPRAPAQGRVFCWGTKHRISRTIDHIRKSHDIGTHSDPAPVGDSQRPQRDTKTHSCHPD